MIVGTAGHIDHGKTTLTRALTGVDTDRLKEEKARGISIELGYAYLDLDRDGDGDGARDPSSADAILGIIDVPGHERLVHTMASGATGIDYALLVVAADDGVMPQTREHLAILALLGVSAGAVAITKSDRVDAARLHAVRGEIAALLADTPLADATLFETAANRPGDPGTHALLAHLRGAARHWRRRHDDGLFRLAIDRVFTLPGQGTVVTGTVFAGRVAVGETLDRVPETAGALPVRVRSIHAQNRPAALGYAGQRCALNLAGAERDALRRGDWIVDPRLRATSLRLDCSLTLLADAGLTLSHWLPLHVHLGSGHHVAHLVLLDDAPFAAGRQGRVQLVFDTPISAVPGDRFIVRNAQATRTVGGGRVLDPFAPARRRRSAARHAWLDAMESLVATGRIDALLAESGDGLATDVLMHLTGLPLAAIALPADAVRLAPRGEPHADGWLFDAARWADLTARMQATLAQYHLKVPDEQGVELARLRRMVAPLAADALWRAAVQQWLRAGDVALSGPWLHLSEHALRLDPADEALAARLLPRLVAGGFDPPWVRNLATAESVDEETVRTVLRKLARQGQVYQVIRDLFYDRARVVALARLVATVAAEAPNADVSAGAYRDATGLGRKRAIQVLEFFDRVGYTRRHRDAHLLRVDSRWLALLDAGDGSEDGLVVSLT
ncbi:selenocysteine-specific translation elongation factor [Robbsia sp. Bb-Pol-6]|uniref:Selenocysteine-specific elongation factor n=1 Tax=Robbsia betulipollinis TaxID=2981849 RepID=A0ABT3ZHE1_9BURK|nr:selenocysteine-specific translation elongation factor [Robbsia betulipollinis]MCY0385837.1 selenocysteine-specific translation elongation factor [Robbsia betulipollinis]